MAVFKYDPSLKRKRRLEMLRPSLTLQARKYQESLHLPTLKRLPCALDLPKQSELRAADPFADF